MAGVNKVILVGNLGRDPEVRHLDNGRAVANFSIATSETYKNKQGERVTTTEWHNMVLWSPLAEIAEKYLKKGNQVYIEGKLTSRSYEDKDGVTKYITEVVGREMTLLGGPRQEGADNSTPPAAASQPSNSEIVDSTVEDSNEIDDLPF
ncbi:single-stranded DNA-binding protein [Reichenbachiella sp. 5M10]|uniref:single-stranded DNA-binding protein n=1 Tax=Reichenbachiella sp. 5M10 TaxID=1889772 RepID=UPI000C155312|nr:single-stranded DNA-binding protein [Reichenbachiella sp. 5M10]PIB37158.1 single-stranded DNA-binding protein [Reichenbachiella sp. 5M10]